MSATNPSSLALTTIDDGSAMVASPVRNNFSATQTAVNALIAVLALATAKGDLIVATSSGVFDHLPAGTNGQALVADSTQTLGVKWSAAPGSRLAYAEFTSTVTSTSTTFAGGAAVVSAGALTFDGSTRIRVEFFAPTFGSSTAANNALLSLADGGAAGTDLGWVGVTNVTTPVGVYGVREFTPPAATKTYSIVAWMSAAGTVSVAGGAGGAGTRLPGFIKITTAP